MNIKQLAIVLTLTVLALLAVFLARVFQLIEIRYPSSRDSKYGSNHPLARTEREAHQSDFVIGDTSEHMFWFVQISDIHISMFHDPDRIKDLEKFCTVTIDAIKPEVVLASGDLTDGKAADNMGSNQYIQEWETYKRVLDESKVVEKTIFLDSRGNHDNFNVPGVSSDRSYFHRFSIQGPKHSQSYMYTVEKESEKYSFIAVDSCLEPGPRRPFNFIGNINQDQFALLSSFEQESQKSTGRIWFGHYPTSCIISPEPGIRQLMQNSTAYLCGHLHTLGGMVKNMYTVQQTGLLELELGDWKDNRMYRVAAFDHGMFSFVDVVHDEWPIILVTNPKHALFSFSHLELMRESSHIRILVFSPQSILRVRVKVDNEEAWIEAKQVKGPLFVAAWNPLLYATGLHNLHVYAEHSDHKFKEIVHPFSLDGTKLSFRLLPKIVLMTHATHVFHGFFFAFVIISIGPFVLFRILQVLIKANKFKKPELRNTFVGNFVRRLWILSSINRLCYPLVLFPLYLTVGPWFIGEVIEGHIGASFAWGTVVKWTLLPTSFTYFYGTIQLFFLHLPFVLIISYCVDARFKQVCGRRERDESSPSSFRITKRHVICTLHLLMQIASAYYFWLAYGTLAFLLGFMRTWSVFLAAYLWYTSVTLSPSEFKEARLLWGKYGTEEQIQNGGGTLLHTT